MRIGFRTVAVVVVGSAIATALLLGSLKHSNAQTQTKSRYLPEYTASGELILPKDFHEWVYVGSPLTPNALNGGEANFPNRAFKREIASSALQRQRDRGLMKSVADRKFALCDSGIAPR